MQEHEYDLVIIGSGPAGGAIARPFYNNSNYRVAVVDRLFGGTCALRGCTPKRAMEQISSAWYLQHRLSAHGLAENPAPVSWPNLLAHKRQFTELVTASTIEGFREAGLATFEGEARFLDEHTLQVGENQQLRADRFAIASGARPTPLPIDGSEHVVTHDYLMENEDLPDHLLFIGGGYIAFELAQIYHTTGRRITIIGSSAQPLPHFESDLVNQITESSLRRGINITLGHRVTAVEKLDSGRFRVTHEKKQTGERQTMEAGLVVHTAGRKPALEALQPEKAGIKLQDGHIVVDQHLRTSQPHIYAAGDVIGRLPFTPVAEREGKVVAENLQSDEPAATIDHHAVPLVLYTEPKLARVGKMEKELQEEGIEYEKKQNSTTDWLLEKSQYTDVAGFKVLTDGNGRILGAHLLGSAAGEVINLFSMAMRHDLPVSAVREVFKSFPTHSYNIDSMLP